MSVKDKQGSGLYWALLLLIVVAPTQWGLEVKGIPAAGRPGVGRGLLGAGWCWPRGTGRRWAAAGLLWALVAVALVSAANATKVAYRSGLCLWPQATSSGHAHEGGRRAGPVDQYCWSSTCWCGRRCRSERRCLPRRRCWRRSRWGWCCWAWFTTTRSGATRSGGQHLWQPTHLRRLPGVALRWSSPGPDGGLARRVGLLAVIVVGR